MGERRGRPRGPAKGKPTPDAILAALAAVGGNVTKAALALGHPRESVRRWTAEIRDGKEKRPAPASDPPSDVDTSDPAAVRAWTIQRLVAIASGDGNPALAALERLASLCGTSSGDGKPQPVDLWARKLLAAALRDFLAGLEVAEKQIYVAAAKPRATADEIEALAALLANTRWRVTLERL